MTEDRSVDWSRTALGIVLLLVVVGGFLALQTFILGRRTMAAIVLGVLAAAAGAWLAEATFGALGSLLRRIADGGWRP